MNDVISDLEPNAVEQTGRKWIFIGVLLLSLCVFWWGRSSAEQWIRESVYYCSTAAMAGFLYYLFRWLQASWRSVIPPKCTCLVGGVVVVASCLLLLVNADYNFKVMPEEYEDASMARNLHEYREAFVSSSGRIKAKEYIPTETFVSDRMWLYPYLVASAHDVVGYRVHAPIVLNVLLLPLFLATFFYLTWRMAGTSVAVLATLLWLSLPLLLQSATGGGASLLGLMLLTLVCVLSAAYLRSPSREVEGALGLGLILLGYTSMSSLCFAVPVLFIIACGWKRSGRRFFSVGLIAVPLLGLPIALQAVRFLANHNGALGGYLMQTWQHLPANLPYALHFFFSYDALQPNSLLLSIVGVVALVALPFLLRSELKRYLADGNLELAAVVIFAPFCILQFAFALGASGVHLDRFQSSFLTLNLHWAMVAAIVVNLIYLRPRLPQMYTAFTWLLVFYIIAFTIPNNSKALYQAGNYRTSEQQWLEQISDSNLRQHTLVIDRFGVPWALREWTSVTPDFALARLGGMIEGVANGRYPAIYIVERLVYSGEGAFVSIDDDESEILNRFETTVVVEKSFRPFTLTRISQLVSLYPHHADRPKSGDGDLTPIKN
ncbi:hypothetical protein ACWPKO_06005 [Coraliomargarita sp. W4R53]